MYVIFACGVIRADYCSETTGAKMKTNATLLAIGYLSIDVIQQMNMRYTLVNQVVVIVMKIL